jgi:hypothetical protein
MRPHSWRLEPKFEKIDHVRMISDIDEGGTWRGLCWIA